MTKVDILQGTLDLLILKTYSNDLMHGFAMALRIRQLTDEVIQIGEGSLYPALYRMKLKGLIKTEWGVTENKLTEAIAKVLQAA